MFLNRIIGSAPVSLNYKIFRSVAEINTLEWDAIAEGKNIYLSLAYLSASESSLSGEIRFHYVIFYDQLNAPVGVAVTQTLVFIDKGTKENKQICTIRNKIKKSFIAGNGINILTCGNPFASGENGFLYNHRITPETAFVSLVHALTSIQKQKYEIGAIAPVILLKEFWPDSLIKSASFKKAGFTDFQIDVNMVMKISPDWKSKNDYLEAMVTKFRTKAKSAYHKSHDLSVRDLDLQEVEKHKTEILDLYLVVLEKSPFRFGVLNEASFVEMKKKLNGNFLIKGYFLNDKLVGFSSAFIFDSVVDANFVGIDYSLNQEFAIYQRMLYDYVELAILRGCNELRFGRTAEEIKSSVGALPVEMKLYVKHKNFIINRVLKSIISKTTPSAYELRKPFKAENR